MEVQNARWKLEAHHGTAMPQYAVDPRRHAAGAWLCVSCSVADGRECWNRPFNESCFQCRKTRPRLPKLFVHARAADGKGGGKGGAGKGGEKGSEKGGGKGAPGRGGSKGGGKSAGGGGKGGGTATGTEDTPSACKKRYEQLKGLFGESYVGTVAAHKAWQEAADKAGVGGAGGRSKEWKSLQKKLELLKPLAGTPDVDEEIKKTEKALDEAKPANTPKSPSAELRAAETVLAAKVRNSKKAEAEIEAVEEAKEKLRERERKALEGRVAAQREMEEAEKVVEAKRLAVAPTSSRLQRHAESIRTVVEAAKARSAKQDAAAWPEASQIVLTSLVAEMENLLVTIEVPAEDETAGREAAEEEAASHAQEEAAGGEAAGGWRRMGARGRSEPLRHRPLERQEDWGAPMDDDELLEEM